MMKGASSETIKIIVLSLGIGLALLLIGLYFLYQGYTQAGEYTNPGIIDSILNTISGGGR